MASHASRPARRRAGPASDRRDRQPAERLVRGTLRLAAAVPTLAAEAWGEWVRLQGRQIEAFVAGSTQLVRGLRADEAADGAAPRPDPPERPVVAEAPAGDDRVASEADVGDRADDVDEVNDVDDVEELPIERYESLAASQVVDRVRHLTPDELVAVRRFEHGTRGRRRVLAEIDRLLGAAPRRQR